MSINVNGLSLTLKNETIFNLAQKAKHSDMLYKVDTSKTNDSEIIK